MTLSDTQIHNLYHREKLSLMRIAKRLDCRVQDVRDALGRIAAAEADANKLSYADFAAKVRCDQIKRSAELAEERRGKRLPVSQVQRSSTAQRKIPVSLPKVSILEETQ